MAKSTRRNLYRALREEPRPKGITPRQWLGVKKFLEVIIDHYPRSCPGQQRLAALVGCDVSSIRRYTRLAQSAGLLRVAPNQGVAKQHSVSYTHEYHIILSGLRPLKLSAEVPSILTYGLPPTIKDPSGLPSVDPSVSSAAPTPGPEEVMTRPSYTQSMEKAKQVGKKTPRRKAPDIDVARRLVDYFLDGWVLFERPERGVDGRGVATGYIRDTFTDPTAGRRYNERQVQRLMDDFFLAVRRDQAAIKDGQSAFMAFVGWWGRKPVRPTTKDLAAEWEAEHPEL